MTTVRLAPRPTSIEPIVAVPVSSTALTPSPATQTTSAEVGSWPVLQFATSLHDGVAPWAVQLVVAETDSQASSWAAPVAGTKTRPMAAAMNVRRATARAVTVATSTEDSARPHGGSLHDEGEHER